MDGVDAIWIFAYYEPGISELAVCDSGVDRGNFLRLDVAENGVDLCVGHCARIGGCDLALLVPDGVR